MEFSAVQIAQLLNGTVVGDDNTKVSSLGKIEEAQSNSLSFLANPKYTEYIYTTNASIVIVANDFEPEKPLPATCTLVKVEDPYSCFATLLEHYQQLKNHHVGISERAHIATNATLEGEVYVGDFVVIDQNVKVGSGTQIHAQAFIGANVTIGEGCVIQPGVKIYDECQIGNNCTIHAGTIIGGDGFGFAPNQDGVYKKVPQIGNVIIGNHVEIGCNSAVDRATLGSTVIKDGVKLDNLVQIGHNAVIGENTVIAGQTGVAGSTKIGKNCMIGGQVGIVGHIEIADEVKIAAQSGVGSSIKQKGAIVQGSPALPVGEYKRSYVLFRRLPDMREQIKNLEKRINQVFDNTINS